MSLVFEKRKPEVRITGKVIGYRLGLYSPDPTDNSVCLVGPIYRLAPDDLREMQRVIEKYNARSNFKLCLAAFPVEG